MSNRIHLQGASLATTLLLIFSVCNCSRLPSEESESNSDPTCVGSPSGTCSNEDYNPTCKFYLAPSSIPDAGFGIYTVEAIPELSPITPNADAPSIVVTDSEKHYPKVPQWFNANYVWSGEGQAEFEGDSVEESVMSFGALTNFHPYLYNVMPENQMYDDTITPQHSPGIGAYSYHAGYQFFAIRDILAGEEIFSHYGENWFDGRGTYGDMVPRKEDYEKCSIITKRVLDHFGDDNITEDNPIISAVAATALILDKRIGSMIPNSASRLRAISTSLDGSGKLSSQIENDIARKLANDSIVQRSLDWILSEGSCLDNLVPEVSTLPDAGRGAFAQRFIPKGTMIVPTPLTLVIDGDESMLTYDFVTDENGERTGVEHDHQPSSAQLLMNYCFSHPHSTLAFCPMTNSILLNHCSTRKSYGGHCQKYNKHINPADRGPNAEIRWASEWDPDTEEWLQLSFDELSSRTLEGQRGLSFEFVAARDIFPGDEVFIDYGETWEKKWEEHVVNWRPPIGGSYTPVKTMNDSVSIFKTPREQRNDPYPDNVMTVCLYWTETDEYDDYKYKESKDWTNNGHKYVLPDHPSDSDTWHWPCTILERMEGEELTTTYTVEIYQFKSVEPTAWKNAGKQRILTNYQSKSIKFMMKPYASDQHLYGIFRSFIEIPDATFPDQWRDKMAN